MKSSELRKKLEELEKEYGDLDVFYFDDDRPFSPTIILHISEELGNTIAHPIFDTEYADGFYLDLYSGI